MTRATDDAEQIVVYYDNEGNIKKAYGPVSPIMRDLLASHLMVKAANEGGSVDTCKLTRVYLESDTR